MVCRIYYLIIIQLLLVTNLFGRVLDSASVVLLNKSKEYCFFVYTDRLGDEITVSIPPDGIFSIRTDKPIALKNLRNRDENYLLFQADSINLFYNNQKQLTMNSKTTSVRNFKTFLKFSFIGDAANAKGFRNEFLLSTPVLRDSILLSSYQQNLLYLSSIKGKDTLKPVHEEYSKRFLYYEYLMEVSKHLTIKSFISGKLPKTYTESLVNLASKLNCDDCLEVSSYREFAKNYLNYLQLTIPAGDLLTYLSEKFNGRTKDYLLFTAMKNLSSSESENFKVNYNSFLSKCNDVEYKTYITNLYNFSTKKIDSNKQSLLAADGTIVSFSDIINKHKGKVIYIDFWATWCAPCMDEMPASINLKKKYQNKNITFLYLSMDKNISSWKSTVSRLGLNSVDNFVVVDGAKSKLAMQLNISSIPHYLIIGKDGRIINRDALRPSDANISAIFDKYISQQ